MSGFLQNRLTLTAVDLPSHGRSPEWPGRGDFTDFCCQTAARHLIQPVDLIGHSFGAVIALRLALERPALVRSLTLIEPVFFAAARADDPKAFAAYQAENAEFEQALQAGHREQATRQFNRVWGDGTRWDSIRPASREYMVDRIGLIRAQVPALVEDNFGILRPGVLGAVDMPCLLMAGGQSPGIVHSINAALLRRLPGASAAHIPEGGHMLPITHPREVSQAIAGLLDQS